MVKWISNCAAAAIFFVLLDTGCSHPDIYRVRPKDGGRVIQPYSCRDPATKEEGVCMFSWNCQRSNGTHLTYCMDRFYFGSCCRLPPGVYIATPPSISSNEVTETQKVKQRPSTQQTTTESLLERWPADSTTEDRKSTRVPAISTRTSTTKPTRVPATEFPPGLYTWRPNGQTKSTLAPIKAKPTKLFSTKPVFASSTVKFNATEKPHHSSFSDSADVANLTAPNTKYSTTDASTIKSTTEPQSASVTSVSRRRTRPTRPYGSTYPKRKTKPTRPYLSRNSTHSKVTQRKTKPTRPMHSSTASVSVTEKVVLTTRPTLGTWSNILDRTTRPFSWRKTTPTPATRRTTPTTVLTRSTTPTITTKRTTPTSVIRSTTSTISTRGTLAPLTRTTVSPGPSIVSSTTSRPTMRTTIGRKRTRPTRPHAVTSSALVPKTTQVTKATKRPSTTTKKPNIEEIIEIITFPPFPGVTHKSTKHPATTTPEIRRTTTLRPKPTSNTTPAVTGISTTKPGTTTTEPPTTTQKIVPGQDYTKVCGRPTPGPMGRIVGGGNSYFGEWPWVVSLRQWKKNAFLHKCGATLLNEFWAITAAHCVENVPLTDILLRMGEYDISHENEPFPFVERRVQIVASHPQFDRRTFEYDLALLRFYEPVVFQRNILPVCIPKGNDTYVGKYATVTGWGRLHEDGPLPNVIQEVSLPIITNKLCENMYRQAGFVEDIPDIFICAGYPNGGKDSCEGDSGGPMVLQEDDGRWVLAGVISWGIGCALPNQPGVYTRITKFAEWINQIIIF